METERKLPCSQYTGNQYDKKEKIQTLPIPGILRFNFYYIHTF